MSGDRREACNSTIIGVSTRSEHVTKARRCEYGLTNFHRSTEDVR